MTNIGALVIHGMGSQKPGFSDGLRAEVSARLGARAHRVVWEELFWADVLEPRESRLWDAMCDAKDPDGVPIPIDMRTIREFVVHNFGDALAYHRDPSQSAYQDVHARVDAHLRALGAAIGDPGAPIVVMAHSLGAHVMSNYIWDRQQRAAGDALAPLPTLAALITFGCNIPLFSLSYSRVTPIDLPGYGIVKPAVKDAARWLNFVDRDDALGWPMKPLYERNSGVLTGAQRHTIDLIEDREINVGGLLTSWNPASHDEYWTDDDFTDPVAKYFGTLLDALDA